MTLDRHPRRPSLRATVAAVALLAAAGLALPAASADLKVLEGQPTAKELEQGLTPTPPTPNAPPGVRFRGITLGGTAPPAPSRPMNTEAAATQAAPGAVAPTRPFNSRPSATPSAVEPSAAIAIRVPFEFGSDNLTAAGREMVDRLGQALQSDSLRTYRFMIEGHTDAVGSDEANLRLSERRARSVERRLVRVHGIDAARLEISGKGEQELLDPDHPTSAANRRVQVLNLGS